MKVKILGNSWLAFSPHFQVTLVLPIWGLTLWESLRCRADVLIKIIGKIVHVVAGTPSPRSESHHDGRAIYSSGAQAEAKPPTARIVKPSPHSGSSPRLEYYLCQGNRFVISVVWDTGKGFFRNPVNKVWGKLALLWVNKLFPVLSIISSTLQN